MAPEIKTIVTKDLFTANDCLNFDYLETAWTRESIPRLSAVSVRALDEEPERNLSLMHADCADAASKLIMKTGRQTYLFLADAPWQPKSSMLQHKRLWRRYPKTLQLYANDLSQEIMVESSEGLRYAGIARIAEDNFSLASQMAWQEQHGAFLIVTRHKSYMVPSLIKSMVDIAFPESKKGSGLGHMVDMLSVSANLCAKGDVIGRVSGDWDSRTVTIDFIMVPEYLDEFVSNGSKQNT